MKMAPEQLRGSVQHGGAVWGASAHSCCQSVSVGQPSGGHLCYRYPLEWKESSSAAKKQSISAGHKQQHSAVHLWKLQMGS